MLRPLHAFTGGLLKDYFVLCQISYVAVCSRLVFGDNYLKTSWDGDQLETTCGPVGTVPLALTYPTFSEPFKHYTPRYSKNKLLAYHRSYSVFGIGFSP